MGKTVIGFVAKIIFVIVVVISFTVPSYAGNWWEDVKLKGNLRYRHEMIEKEDVDARHRQRIRARVGIFAKANEKINIGIQMATGSDDPLSTNQTLDNAASTKDFRLDLAYFAFKCDQAAGFEITAGKIKNPFFKPGKSELIWDSDWNPEGGAVSYNHKSNNFDLTLIGSGFWINERSSSDDSYLLSEQAALKIYLNEAKSNVTVGGGFFNFVNAKGFQPFYNDEKSMGNSLMEIEFGGDTISAYANDFEIAQIFVELNHKFASIPVTLMGDIAINTAADSLKTGWLVGVQVGKAKKTGSWEFRYNYREIEKDAVIGAFADSDFSGGGTNAKGHEIGGAYQVMKNTAFQMTYFSNEIGIDQDEIKNYQRFQVDLQLKF